MRFGSQENSRGRPRRSSSLCSCIIAILVAPRIGRPVCSVIGGVRIGERSVGRSSRARAVLVGLWNTLWAEGRARLWLDSGQIRMTLYADGAVLSDMTIWG